MIGLVTVLLASFLFESGTSIGKKEAAQGHEGIFGFAFINHFFVFIFFAVWALIWPDSFSFSLKSLPTFITRLVLEFIQIYIAILAITKADRTTFSFFRIITIPLLLIIDLVLGYSLASKQIIGVVVLFIGLLVALFDKAVNKKYIGLILLSGINSAITISLYKYNISHFNSFIAEQLVSTGILLIAIYFVVIYKERVSPFRLLKQHRLFLQSFSQGAASLVESFAYVLLPASVLVAISRSASVVWSTVFGGAYFKEKNIFHKALIVIIIITGFILLI